MMSLVLQLASKKKTEARKRSEDALCAARQPIDLMRSWHCDQHAEDLFDEVLRLENQASILSTQREFFADLQVLECAKSIDALVRKAVTKQRTTMNEIGSAAVSAAEEVRKIGEPRATKWAPDAIREAEAALKSAKSLSTGKDISYDAMTAFVVAAKKAQLQFELAGKLAESRRQHRYELLRSTATVAGTILGAIGGLVAGFIGTFVLCVVAYIVTLGGFSRMKPHIGFIVFGTGCLIGMVIGGIGGGAWFRDAIKKPE